MSDLQDTLGGKTVEELDESSGSSSSSSSGDDDDEYPKYFEDTPFMVVYEKDGKVVVRNEPADIEITYRQYQSDSDTKLWEVPDEVLEYWMGSWGFKSDSQRYEKENDSNLLEDLRNNPLETLEKLSPKPDHDRVVLTAHCAVCDRPIESGDDRVMLQSKYVCPHHTADELADILNFRTNVKITDSQGNTVREVPDTDN